MPSEKFLDLILNAQSIKRKMDKLDLIFSKSFCSMKDHVKRMKRSAPE